MKIGVRNRGLARFCSSQLGLAEEFAKLFQSSPRWEKTKVSKENGNKHGEDMCLAFKGIQMFRKTKKNRSKEW